MEEEDADCDARAAAAARASVIDCMASGGSIAFLTASLSLIRVLLGCARRATTRATSVALNVGSASSARLSVRVRVPASDVASPSSESGSGDGARLRLYGLRLGRVVDRPDRDTPRVNFDGDESCGMCAAGGSDDELSPSDSTSVGLRVAACAAPRPLTTVVK